MELNKYQEQAMTTCMDSSRNVEYMLLNLIGEVGELAEKFMPNVKEFYLRQMLGDMVVTGQIAGKYAKAIRKGEVNVFAPINISELAGEQLLSIEKELGDVQWQTAGLASVLSLPLEHVAQMNLDKLAARKQAGTIDGNGDGINGKDRTV